MSSKRFTESGRIVFFGEELVVTPEVEVLVFDQLATGMIGVYPRSRPRGSEIEGQDTVNEALDHLAGTTENDDDIYAYMVRPNDQLDGSRPIEMIAQGGLARVLHQIDEDFSIH